MERSELRIRVEQGFWRAQAGDKAGRASFVDGLVNIILEEIERGIAEAKKPRSRAR